MKYEVKTKVSDINYCCLLLFNFSALNDLIKIYYRGD